MSATDNWRFESAYNYLDELNPSDLAWEFLRRNSLYREHYAKLVTNGQLDSATARQFAEHWGLRFRYGSDAERGGATCLLDPHRKPCIRRRSAFPDPPWKCSRH